MREVTVRCDELDHRMMVSILPAGSRVRAGEVCLAGITAPIRVWLVPGTVEDDVVTRFIEERLTRDKGGAVKRSVVWREWQEHGAKSMFTKGQFLVVMKERLGAPIKRKAEWVYLGYAQTEEDVCRAGKTADQPRNTVWQST